MRRPILSRPPLARPLLARPLLARPVLALVALIGLAACAQPDNRPPAVTPETVKGGEPAKIKITAREMLGQSNGWLMAKLGEPAFKRADRVANIWQYKNSHCVLNVFLYADDAGPSAPTRILHFDARDAHGDNTDRDQCLSVLQD